MIKKFLQDNPFLVDLFEKIPESVENTGVYLTLPKETILYKQQEPVEFVTFICSGTVRVVKESTNGNCLIIKYFYKNDIVGTLEIIGEQNFSACTVIAHTDCEVIKIPKADFLDWIDRDLKLCRHIVKMQAKTIYDSSEHLIERTYHSTLLYVSLYLINVVKSDLQKHQVVVITKKREQIAEELYISLRSLTRYINKLKSQGLLDIVKGKINISQQQYLALTEFVKTLD